VQTPPKIGTSYERSFAVEPNHTIDLAPEVFSPVLSTPSLIWFLEHTALDLMLPYLEEGEITVGVQVDVEHLAPTPCSCEVTCRARVVHTEGPLVTFHLEAHDPQEQIAKGLHKRRVLRAQRLAKRVGQKEAPRP
jgi:fluoroacetyl-CoA thioesterase